MMDRKKIEKKKPEVRGKLRKMAVACLIPSLIVCSISILQLWMNVLWKDHNPSILRLLESQE